VDRSGDRRDQDMFAASGTIIMSNEAP